MAENVINYFNQLHEGQEYYSLKQSLMNHNVPAGLIRIQYKMLSAIKMIQ